MQTKHSTSMPVIQTGVYPHMPIADHQSPRNTNSLQHWPSPTRRWPVSHTTHGPRLSSQVCCTRLTTVQRVIDFSIYDLGDYPWTKVYQKGRRPTTHLSLPSYKISARSRIRSTRYALPKFFTFWP